MSKRIKNPVIDKLRAKRRDLQRVIDKINGHSVKPTYYLIEGDGWIASSFDGPTSPSPAYIETRARFNRESSYATTS